MTTENPQPQGIDDSPEFQAYVRPVWQRKWLILAVVALTTAATYWYYDRKPRVYESTAQMFIGASPIDQALYGFSLAGSDRYIDNQVILLQSAETRRQAEKILRSSSELEELSGFSASAQTGTDFVAITSTAGSPGAAAATANSVAEGYIEARSDENRQRARDARELAESQLATLPSSNSFDIQRDELRADVQRFKAIEGTPAGDASVVQRAEPNPEPIAPEPAKNARFAFVLSLLAAVGLAFLLERFDRRLKRVEDIAKSYETTLLAAIPHQDPPTPVEDGANVLSGPLKETFRGLRTNLQLAALDQPIQTILVTSAVPGEGKSTTIRNLALAFAEWGLRVVAVDGDLRQAKLAKGFHIESHIGLTDVLTGEVSLDDALIDVPMKLQGMRTLAQISSGDEGRNGEASHAATLKVLPAGRVPANPQAVLATSRVQDVLAQLRRDFDVVLLDTAPVLAVSDAIPLIPAADGVIVVARLNETTRDAAKRLVEVLGRSRGKIVGVVANDLPVLEMRGGGYTYYGYRYGQSYGMGKRGRKQSERIPEPPATDPDPAPPARG